MPHRQQLSLVIDQIISSDEQGVKEVESTTIDDYQKLSDKCDVVISKIKTRKAKKGKGKK